MDLERLRQILEVNVIGVVAVTKAFVPLLRRDEGRLVNIGSAAGFTTPPLYGAYAASKHALEAITDASRIELGAWNISVSLLEPGSVESKIREKNVGKHAAHRSLSKEEYELYLEYFDPLEQKAAEIEASAAPANVTTQAIIHALVDPFPKTRYVVAGFKGTPLWPLRLLLPFIPDRLQDQIKTKATRRKRS